MVDSFDDWFQNFARCSDETQRINLCTELAQSFDVMFDHYTLDASNIIQSIGPYWYHVARFLPSHSFARRLNKRASSFAKLLDKNMFYFTKGLCDSAVDQSALASFGAGLGSFAGEFLSQNNASLFLEVIGAQNRESDSAQDFFKNVDGRSLASVAPSVLALIDDEHILHIQKGRTELLCALPAQKIDALIQSGLSMSDAPEVAPRLTLHLSRNATSPLTLARLVNTSHSTTEVLASIEFTPMLRWSTDDWKVFLDHLHSAESFFNTASKNAGALARVLRNKCSATVSHAHAIQHILPSEDLFIRNLSRSDLAVLATHSSGILKARFLSASLKRSQA